MSTLRNKIILLTFTIVASSLFTFAQSDLDQALVHQVTRTRTDIEEIFDGDRLASIPFSATAVRYRNQYWALGFLLDPGWKRVVYAKVYLGGFYPVKWVKATGPSGTGWTDLILETPQGIATDIPDVNDTPHERDVYVDNRRTICE